MNRRWVLTAIFNYSNFLAMIIDLKYIFFFGGGTMGRRLSTVEKEFKLPGDA